MCKFVYKITKSYSNKIIMNTFSVVKDHETPRHAGADGFFQIIEIKDNDDNNVTSKFDQGKLYANDGALAIDISIIFEIDLNLIEIIEN